MTVISVVTFFSSIVVLITISARGADHPPKPSNPTFRAMFRLHVEKIGLLCMGLGAGAALFGVLAGKPIDPLTALVLFATAIWMLTHPKGWWQYVTSLTDCDTRRADP